MIRGGLYLWIGLLVGLLNVTGGCGGSDVEVMDARNYFLEAQEALKQGDTTKAIAAFTASIESKPNAWAYMERAKLNAAAGQDQQALDDAQKAVELEPENSDTAWLVGELKKPAAQRFKGIFAVPPSARK
jgi:tetratricopeptide (TPR) repeat protein